MQEYTHISLQFDLVNEYFRRDSIHAAVAGETGYLQWFQVD